MNNKLIAIAVSVIAITSLLISVFNFINAPKIAYVRTAVIVENYSGMKEARALYNLKLTQWQSNIDTLQLQLEKSYSDEATNKEKISQDEQMLASYQSAVEEKAIEEEQKMLQGVLNQINTSIEAYALKHNYDIILGTTTSGNVLYGSKVVDITDLVLKELNDNYKK
jgi:outer membrane protein